MQLTTGTTVAEQIGQVIMAGFDGLTPTPEIVALIEQHQIGGIILFGRNIRDAEQLLALTSDLQAVAKAAGHRYPLLISVDQENGMIRQLNGGATQFPGSMSLGAIGSEQVAYEIAYATGRELRALGINMNLAPVVDVNNNPANPIIGVRSFGEDPQLVGRLAVAAVRGYRDAGVITSLKHFPGHGDTAVDSHRALPVVPHDLDRLEAVELVPFRAAIAAGAETVMVAHIAFPHLMPDASIPSTLSPEVVDGLLRRRLGYTGVIVSDCLEMNAVSETVGTERGTAMALCAGIDLVLVSHRYDRQLGSIAAVQAALDTGELSATRLREAAEHVLQLKARFLDWERLPERIIPAWVGGPDHAALVDRTYAAAVTLLRDDAQLLPVRLQPTQQILVVYPEREELIWRRPNRFPPAFLAASIRQRHAHVMDLAYGCPSDVSDWNELLDAAACADLIVMATNNAHMFRYQAEIMQRLLALGTPLIGILARDPYDFLLFPELGACIAAYEYTPAAMEAAARIIFGEQPARGKLPVTLPGLYERGAGITG